MDTRLFFSSERPVYVVMLFTLAPWVGIALLSGGPLVALFTSGYAVLVFAVGYALVSTMLPTGCRSQAILLAPATGIMLLSALTAFWVRLGLPLIWVSIPWLSLIVAGAMGLWRDCNLLHKTAVEYGFALVALSTVICAVYYTPGAFNDDVLRADGSYNWIYIDTQYFHSIAASIIYCHGPPTMPGMATLPLLYHFGPYAPAAVISSLTGLDLGHALVRVTRGVEQWSLVLACFGMSAILAVKATGNKFGGIMSVAGLFFYGSLLSLFDDTRNSSSSVGGAILVGIPGVAVVANGGPFAHFILGHSVLHGMVAISAILGLCLIQRGQEDLFKWRSAIFMTLPMWVIPVNSVAAIYCLGIVSILLLWGHLGTMRCWLAILLMLCLFVGGWKLMGYGRAPDTAGGLLNLYPNHQLWWSLAVWLMVGLGFRIEGFRWVSKDLEDPVSALVVATFIGLTTFFIFVHLDGNERYGMYFLQCMFSIFAFSRLTPGFYRSGERNKWISNWLALAKWITLLIITIGGSIGILEYLLHGPGHTEIPLFNLKLLAAFLLLLSLTVLSLLIKRGGIPSAVLSIFLSGILLSGFLAWIEPWLNFGEGRQKMDITLTPGEVQGLKCLNKLAPDGERFATNKHSVDSMAFNRERSYAYDSLSKCPVLLEGYQVHDAASSPGFKTLLRDNDLMFTTTNAETLRDISTTYHVRWLVARPGTDIALQRPLPSWLDEETNCGTLRIYRIN